MKMNAAGYPTSRISLDEARQGCLDAATQISNGNNFNKGEVTVHGVIRGMSQYYADGLERLYIAVDKWAADGLPHQDHQRIELILLVGHRQHRVGIRTTPRDRYIWIGPDLDDGMPKLAHILKAEGYAKNQRVVLEFEGSTLRLSPQ